MCWGPDFEMYSLEKQENKDFFEYRFVILVVYLGATFFTVTFTLSLNIAMQVNLADLQNDEDQASKKIRLSIEVHLSGDYTNPRSPGAHFVGPWVIDSINLHRDLRTGNPIYR